jgi:two-component system nitrate/nitrite response regulator NarL
MDPEQLVTAFNSGVNGYLLHDEMVPETVLRALELVLVDGTVVPRGFTKLLGSSIDWPLTVMTPAPAEPPATAAPSTQAVPAPTSSIVVAAPPASDQCLARLSDREQLILGHLTRGASNKRIARDLNIAEATVKAHIKSLLRKLRVNNRTQAAMWAINHTTRAEPEPTQSAAEP